MNQAKTGQILKIREEILIKELKPQKNLEGNFMEYLILEDLGEFQWFWAVLEERKKKEEF